MKFGFRTPNLKKSFKARTTGRIKRSAKKAINPFYGKKGMGYITNPKKAVYNKVYNKTTFGINDIVKGGLNMTNNNTKSNNISESKHSSNSKKSFFKDKKNIVIIVLSFLTLSCLLAYSNSNNYESHSQIEELNNQINTLKDKNNELSAEIQNNNNQINSLQQTNKSLREELNTANEQKQEPVNQVTETPKTTPTSNNNSSSSKKTSSENAGTSKKTSSQASTSTNKFQMVWVGETGSKYHNQGCRTLKGKGHQITLQQAQSEGRAPCKVCH